MKLHTGRTTKAEVFEKFGPTNIVTRDGAGCEVWSYQRAMQAFQGDAVISFWRLFLVGQ